MANEVLLKTGTAVVWADTTDYPGSPTDKPSRTHQIDVTGLTDGSGREGAKADLGATRARLYTVELAIELQAVPTAGLTVDVYFGWSHDATAGDGNPGELTGADAAYSGTNSNLDESVLQFDGPYSLVVTDVTAATKVHKQVVGVVTPLHRFVVPVIVNNSGQTGPAAAGADECYLALYPVIDEIQ